MPADVARAAGDHRGPAWRRRPIGGGPRAGTPGSRRRGAGRLRAAPVAGARAGSTRQRAAADAGARVGGGRRGRARRDGGRRRGAGPGRRRRGLVPGRCVHRRRAGGVHGARRRGGGLRRRSRLGGRRVRPEGPRGGFGLRPDRYRALAVRQRVGPLRLADGRLPGPGGRRRAPLGERGARRAAGAHPRGRRHRGRHVGGGRAARHGQQRLRGRGCGGAPGAQRLADLRHRAGDGTAVRVSGVRPAGLAIGAVGSASLAARSTTWWTWRPGSSGHGHQDAGRPARHADPPGPRRGPLRAARSYVDTAIGEAWEQAAARHDFDSSAGPGCGWPPATP